MYEWLWRHLMTYTENTNVHCTLSYGKKCVTLLHVLTNDTKFRLLWKSAQLQKKKMIATILKDSKLPFTVTTVRDKGNKTPSFNFQWLSGFYFFAAVSEIWRVHSCAQFSNRRAKIHVRHHVPLRHPACSVPTVSRKVAHFCQTSRFQLELSLSARVVPSFVIRPRDSGSAAAARWSDTIKNIQRYFQQLWVYL